MTSSGRVEFPAGHRGPADATGAGSELGDLVDRVRSRLVLRAFTAPAADPTGGGAPAEPISEVLRDEAGGILDDAVFERLRRDVEADLHGAGPLEALLARPGVTDVLVNAPDSVWVDDGTGLHRTSVRFSGEAAVRALAQRLAAAAGRRLDDAMPFADVVLPDGTRLHAVLPPIVPVTTVSLRVLGRRTIDLTALIETGAVPLRIAALLRAVMVARLALVVSGGTGAGKTTLLGALLSEAAPGDRLLLIEDAPELVVRHPHVVRLITRPANVEGAGAVGLRELVRQALRMRPDRLVVGEFRGAEMVELLVALNTGHEGGAATLHANSAADVPARFAALGALAGLAGDAVADLVASAVHLVVHLRRGRDGRRGVNEIGLLSRTARGPTGLQVDPVWSASSGAGPAADRLSALLEQRGVDGIPL